MPALNQRVVSAGIWVFGSHSANQLLRLIGNLLLARLLAPDAFGIMAIATVLLTGLSMFSDMGLRQVVVRSPHAEHPSFLDSVWTLQVCRGLLLAALMGMVAWALAWARPAFPPDSAYARPELPGLLLGLSVVALLNGLESTKLLLAERHLQNRRIAVIDLCAQVGGLLAMLAWAYVSPSVYALLVGALLSACVRVVVSQWWLPGPANRFRWHRCVIQEVAHFGSWIVVTSAVGFLISSGDRLLIGGLLSATEMGQYAVAVLLIAACQDLVSKLVGSVAYPAISEVYRTHPQGLRQAYYRARLPVDALCLLAAGGLWSFGADLVRILYDQRYQDAGAYLGLLALTLVASRYTVTSQVYFVLGKPQYALVLQVLRLSTLVTGVFAGHAWGGGLGAVMGVVFSHGAGMVLNLAWLMPRLGLLDASREVRSLLFWGVGWLGGVLLSWLYRGVL